MGHECTKAEFLGQVKEFMDNSKGLRTLLGGIVVAIILQVGTFIFLWGSLTTTVKDHTKHIDEICNTLKNVKVIGYAIAGEKGEQGIKGDIGLQGIPGKDFNNN